VSGLRALAFAGRHSAVVDRVVLVGTPVPEDDGLDFAAVTAKTLLLYGRADARHGAWWQKRLPAARLEVNPDGHDDLLAGMWHRVLSHVAPRCKRPA
jgi:pimeloyl-ACP methyl ester carboxylesterase